jgi:hypothetical protein
VQPVGAHVLVVEVDGEVAPAVAAALRDAHLVGTSAIGPTPSAGGDTRFSRVITGDRLPFGRPSFRGAALLGTPTSELLRGVARLLLPGSRIVVDRASEDTSFTLRNEGFEPLLDQAGVVVAGAPNRR